VEGVEPEPKKSLPSALNERSGEPRPADGDDADKEAKQLSRGLKDRDLERECKLNEHDRDQKFRKHFEFLSIFAMYALFGVMGFLGAIWLYHIVMPDKCKWLTCDQVTIIQDILTGGIIAGLLADHFKKRLS
jgi:hypothetical protein